MKESLLEEQANSLGWYGGFTDVRHLFHHLHVWHSSSELSHNPRWLLELLPSHLCCRKKERKGERAKKESPLPDVSNFIKQPSCKSPPNSTLKSCVPDISHLAKPWCKGGWEIQSFPLSMCPAKSLHFITRRGE